MAKGKRNEEEDGSETIGSDVEQTIAMLERAEIDYDKQQSDDDDDTTTIVIEGILQMNFDEDGNLTGVERAD